MEAGTGPSTLAGSAQGGAGAAQTKSLKEQVAEIIASYRNRKGALVPLLLDVQERFGYVPEEAIRQVARAMRVSPSEVFGVITFYPRFRLTPVGRNVIRVCEGAACHLAGGWRIQETLERELGIKFGETTPDMEFTLEASGCMGSCGLAPVVMLNDQTYGGVTQAKAVELLAEARQR